MVAWALAALGANALYWHHGIHMGPRMLYESTPAWVALVVASVFGLTARSNRASLRSVAAWSAVLTLLGTAALMPSLVAARRLSAAPPLPSATTPTLVFAHGSWASRVAARLAATGMRRDSIETALRRNDLCDVDRYARWRAYPAGPTPPALDLEPHPGSPTDLQTRLLSPGNPVRVSAVGAWDEVCAREATADRFGVIELELLAWRTPASGSAPVRVARDLGPAGNASIPAVAGERRLVYVAGPPGTPPRLLAYREGMELLWRGAAGAGNE
jgi:hypothetical protein